MQTIQISFTREMVHSWPDCPAGGKYSFLRFPHSHKFRITVELEVREADREVEFYALRDLAADELRVLDESGRLEFASCEEMAQLLRARLLGHFPWRWLKVSVFEDGDFGASEDGVGAPAGRFGSGQRGGPGRL